MIDFWNILEKEMCFELMGKTKVTNGGGGEVFIGYEIKKNHLILYLFLFVTI